VGGKKRGEKREKISRCWRGEPNNKFCPDRQKVNKEIVVLVSFALKKKKGEEC